MGPVTTVVIALCLLCTGGVHLGLYRPQKLTLHLGAILVRGHIWRLLSCFLYFGRFDLALFIDLMLLGRYLSKLELDHFAGKTADVVFMLLFLSICMLIGGFIARLKLLSDALLLAIIWIWCRKNESASVSYFVITTPAPYFPWVLVGVHFIIRNGGNILSDVVGIAAGHLYIYATDILPITHNLRLRTPVWLQNCF